MTVANILKGKHAAVLWVSPTLSVGAVAQRLRSAGVGVMIVSNDGESLLGLISERDITHGLAVHGAALALLKVSDLMARSVITCTPEDRRRCATAPTDRAGETQSTAACLPFRMFATVMIIRLCPIKFQGQHISFSRIPFIKSQCSEAYVTRERHLLQETHNIGTISESHPATPAFK